MSLRVILWVIDISAIILSVLWFIKEPNYEPIITGILSLGGLVTLLFTNKKSTPKMIQKAGKNSEQYQSGGDMTINK